MRTLGRVFGTASGLPDGGSLPAGPAVFEIDTVTD